VTVTIQAYDYDDVAVGDPIPITRRTFNWTERGDDDTGSATFELRADPTDTRLAEARYFRVAEDAVDRFGFWIRQPVFEYDDNGWRARLACVGLRQLYKSVQIRDANDLLPPANVRWFGWMSREWTMPAANAVELGAVGDEPYGTARPAAYPDRAAQLISYSGDSTHAAGSWRARSPSITVSETTDALVLFSADDEVRQMFLSGVPIGERAGEKYLWKDYEAYRVTLEPGVDYYLAAELNNLDIAPPNPTWLVASIVKAAGDGKPAAANQIDHMVINATAGTWTLSVDGQLVTLNWDDSGSEQEDAINAVVGDGEVSVTGAGTGADPYRYEWSGPSTSYRPLVTIENGAGLTGTVQYETIIPGASADFLLHTDADWWVESGPTAQGVTPGTIMLTCQGEGTARGSSPITGAGATFGEINASDGSPWPLINIPVALGNTTMDDLFALLATYGVQVAIAPDRAMEGWYQAGDDRTAEVVFTPGVNAAGVKLTEDRDKVRNVWFTRTKKGVHESSDGPSVTARRRWEAGVVATTYPDEDAAATPVDNERGELAAPPQRVEWDIVPGSGAPLPYAGAGTRFHMWDVITGPTPGGDQVRVLEISITVDDGRLLPHVVGRVG
jgi:hypothetical protein